MNMRFLILTLFFINGCIYYKKNFVEEIRNDNKNYFNLKQTYLSCSGKGEIEFEGESPFKLSFNYISQRDSSFIQFIDFLGRKSFLIWLTADTLEAWSLMDNKKYNQYQLITAFPFLNNVSPGDITKILWGIKPDNPKKLSNNISYSFNSKTLNNNIFVSSAILNNRKYNQSLIINIYDREHNSQSVDLHIHWQLIRS